MKILVLLLLFPIAISAQDTTFTIDKKVVTLKEVVVRNNLNVPALIERIEKDTSFHKAFKNLKILGYTALNDIRMTDKKGAVKASLQSKTQQSVHNGCRSMQVLEERTTGDIYDEDKNWNYYTGELYAGLLLAKDTICGETNIVKDADLSIKNKSGIAKHKEQLKMLFFNPGKRIPGIPFIGDKIAIFEDNQAALYDFEIDMQEREGQNCYVFTVKARENLTSAERDRIVINEMITWFNSSTMDIVGRNYDLSYNAAVYDFDVHMEVELTKVFGLLVPKVIRYTGEWHTLFKKRERGVFTATLFDFVR